MTLKRWQEYGWLKAEATSPAEINNLLEITIRSGARSDKADKDITIMMRCCSEKVSDCPRKEIG